MRYSRNLIIHLLVLSLAYTGLACTPPAEADGVVPRLNGTVIFDDNSCNASAAKIQQAMNLAFSQIKSPAMDDCMRQAIFSYTESGFAEEVISQMRQNMPTHVKCANLGGDLGQAPVNVSSETLTLDLTFVQNKSAATITETILHEVAHNKGYTHADNSNTSRPGDPNPPLAFFVAFEFQFTVPEQIERCSNSLAAGITPPVPNGLRRDALALETTLAPTGRNGGSLFEIPCPAGQTAMGIQVRSGTLVDAIGLSCRAPGGTSITRTSLAGGSGGTFTFNDCFPGEVLVGVHGRAGNVNDAVGPICSSVADVNAGIVNVFREPQHGGSGGVAYDRLCPRFMSVRAVKGKSGSQVDRLEVECQQLNQLKTVSEHHLSPAGGAGGTRTIEKCPGRSALVGLSYQTGSLVDRLGGICSQVTTSCSGATCTDSIGPVSHYMQAHGGTGGKVADDICSKGSVLVGLQIRSGTLIDAIGGVCASAAAWSGTGGVSTSDLPIRGGSGGSLTTQMCARGEFLVGWEIGSGTLVDSLQADLS